MPEITYVVDVACSNDDKLTLFQKYKGEIWRKVVLTKWQIRKLGFLEAKEA